MAATGTRYETTNIFYTDQNGVPGARYQLFFYETGTTTLQPTYQDVNLTTPNTNPVVADANGYFGNIWLIPSNAYRVALYTAVTDENPSGVQVWTLDPVGPASGGAPANSVGIVGEVRAFAGPEANIPAQWYVCAGQAFSRTTFVSLFNVIGTTWGSGDGTTTFNLPDFRGRAPFGVDNMGGTPANRVTAGGSGVAGNTLGATGGDQLLQQHTHSVNDPTHTHTLTDAGHTHFQQIAQGSGSDDAWNITGSGTPTSIGYTTQSSQSGITIALAATGITIGLNGGGSQQNMPPAAMVNMIIYAGA